MKLYLIADDVLIQEHLFGTFAEKSPYSLTAVPLNFENESFVFIHDKLLETISEMELKAFFVLHVMVLSTTPTFEKAQYYLALGAKGYGNAHMHASHLLYAYEIILEENVWLPPEYISRLIKVLPFNQTSRTEHLSHLSEREKEVALLLASGDSHKEIADALDITVRTVKAHATAIYHKLTIKDRLSLALLLH